MPADRWKTTLATLALLLAVVLVSHRVFTRLGVSGAPDPFLQGLADFRDVIRYPVVDLLAGENPYDFPGFSARHAVEEGIGLYSPATLLLHLPFGLGSPLPAALAYYLAMLVATVALAAASLRLCGVETTAARVLGLGALLMLTRPGEWNLFNGQVALQTTFATWAALWWGGTRPVLGGLGLAAASFKVTYGGPLLLLMLARGHHRAVALGIGLAVALNAAAILPIASRAGLSPFVESVAANWERRANRPHLQPDATALRVDGTSLLGRLLGRKPTRDETVLVALATLLPAAYGLRRLAGRADHDARLLSLGVASLATLVCTYHQQYDVLVLVALLTWLLWPSAASIWRRRPRLRAVALTLLAIPFANYAATFTAAGRLGLDQGGILVVSSLNNVALLVLLGLLVSLAVAEPRALPRGAAEAPPSSTAGRAAAP